ncbi:hypothetical protein [Mesorhizobium sp. LjNodule214]|uniref:hypothetical protein n=1 Tax=Mesorhizobium sp. LjNodule214 TaxID=3342252 RepID=UPI003ED0AF78
MGMDVFGVKPTSRCGSIFMRPAWAWHALAGCVITLAAVETSSCREWHSNSGDGLDAAQSIKLADKLDALIESGAVPRYIGKFGKKVKVVQFADELEAAFRGEQSVELADELEAAFKCAQLMDFADELRVEDVCEFSAFCRASGGFEIHSQ